METVCEGLKAHTGQAKRKRSDSFKTSKRRDNFSVIFGGKKNFYERLKGKLTNQGVEGIAFEYFSTLVEIDRRKEI